LDNVYSDVIRQSVVNLQHMINTLQLKLYISKFLNNEYI